MKASTALALLFGAVGGGVLLLHFLRHPEQGLGSIEGYLIGGCILASAFLADPAQVGGLVKSVWPFPHGKHRDSDDPADHRGT
jgi:hypothetical protein